MIDNVHMNNVNIEKTGDFGVGALLHYANFSMVRNSSFNNVKINTEGSPGSINIGGIAGHIGATTVENCYVQGLNITDSKGVSAGIGGLVGYVSSTSSIRNCYSEGRINSDNVNVGGIIGRVGTTKIENCYSKVNYQPQTVM